MFAKRTRKGIGVSRFPAMLAWPELRGELLEAAADQPVDAPAFKRAGLGHGLDRPRQHQLRSPAQLLHHVGVEQPTVDRHAGEAPGTAPQPCQLADTADRVDDPDLGARGERLEQTPVLRAHGQPVAPPTRFERRQHAGGQPAVMTLEIQHQLGAGGRLGQQLVQEQPGSPRRSELPAVPQDRDRPDRLAVADLEAAAEEVDVSLDERDAQPLGRAEPFEVVARPVGDDE